MRRTPSGFNGTTGLSPRASWPCGSLFRILLSSEEAVRAVRTDETLKGWGDLILVAEATLTSSLSIFELLSSRRRAAGDRSIVFGLRRRLRIAGGSIGTICGFFTGSSCGSSVSNQLLTPCTVPTGGSSGGGSFSSSASASSSSSCSRSGKGECCLCRRVESMTQDLGRVAAAGAASLETKREAANTAAIFDGDFPLAVPESEGGTPRL